VVVDWLSPAVTLAERLAGRDSGVAAGMPCRGRPRKKRFSGAACRPAGDECVEIGCARGRQLALLTVLFVTGIDPAEVDPAVSNIRHSVTQQRQEVSQNFGRPLWRPT
jgi:hypothetical protein